MVSGSGPTQEVRFAVVMYGGVSLAIYINGVAQELLRMVRATAGDLDASGGYRLHLPDARLGDTDTERVYRRLGRILRRSGPPLPLADARDGAPVRTRFVVDVLSGTSAGGLNAVFLAKALANDQSIDQLKRLWLDEGDIGKLINDQESLADMDGMEPQDPPRSLLNSRRMYRRLREAFEGMDRPVPSTAEQKSPYAREIDLFVTTTDIRGLPISLRLADNVVREKRHRNVFHFRYRDGSREEPRNDFHAGNNTFLAFASRCTSAFPFAFEPMRLADTDPLLARTDGRLFDREEERLRAGWRDFFPAYRPPMGPATAEGESGTRTYDFVYRAFGDGGYLDNKPFTYAIEAMAGHRATLPVDRKLMYVEPSPEEPPMDGGVAPPPNALENGLVALSLARYETIREDLQRILERNRLISRVERITAGMEDDVRLQRRKRPAPLTTGEYVGMGLDAMIGREGLGYGGYHRLKVAAVTDDIAAVVAQAAGLEPESDELLAIRHVVRAWRDASYAEVPPAGAAPGAEGGLPSSTQNLLLVEYDLGYRIRRNSFVLGRLDQLACRDEDARRLLARTRPDDAENLPSPEAMVESPAFGPTLAAIRGELAAAVLDLQRVRDRLLQRGEDNPLHAEVRGSGISPGQLRTLLALPTEKERDLDAAAFFGKNRDRVLRLAAALAGVVRDGLAGPDGTWIRGTIGAAEQSGGALRARGSDGPVEAATRAAVSYFYDFYDDYDLITFPILYATGSGEELDRVEVVRVSPEDALSLVGTRERARHKLAGNALAHFGAFLDRGWRMNDVLWGRLDGAERIIATLLPGERNAAVRDELIRDAHLAILADEFRPADRDVLCQLLSDAMAREGSTDAAEQQLRSMAARKPGARINPVLQAALRSSLEPATLHEFFRSSYQVSRHLDPQAAVRNLARSTRVVGGMLEGMAAAYRVDRRPFAWVTRLGRVFWGLVEVAVPGSFWNLLFRHWLKLLYLFGVLMVVAGALFLNSGVRDVGIGVLLLTVTAHFATALLGDFMHDGPWWQRALRGVVGVAVGVVLVAVLGLAAVGADRVFGLRERLGLSWRWGGGDDAPAAAAYGAAPAPAFAEGGR